MHRLQTGRHTGGESGFETKIKVRGAGEEEVGYQSTWHLGHAGRLSNGQVQRPNRQKEEKCLSEGPTAHSFQRRLIVINYSLT